ncbi:MAG: zinc ribbon domain-containing protein [Phycisphaerales bacterium]|nr:zinc ribbon domain-containing protein [Phycisphaerales bacterium]
MPIYEYRCPECRHTFDELLRAGDRSKVSCPKCGNRRPEPVLSVFAAHSAASKPSSATAGCGRCGDPNGPCQA